MPQTDHRARGGISPRRQCPRLALILLELSENFGVPDGRGLRLTLPARHRILSELVGASRSRITEHLSMFERKHLSTGLSVAPGSVAAQPRRDSDGAAG